MKNSSRLTVIRRLAFSMLLDSPCDFRGADAPANSREGG